MHFPQPSLQLFKVFLGQISKVFLGLYSEFGKCVMQSPFSWKGL